MRAYRITAWERPPELVDTAVPEPGPGQLLVKVAGNGLCHSDLTMMAIPASIGTMLGWRGPFTLGHETAGWIEAIGPGPRGPNAESGLRGPNAEPGLRGPNAEPAGEGLRPGDAVALVSPASCGACARCRRGEDSLCDAGLVGRGYGRDGGLAEFVLVEDVRTI